MSELTVEQQEKMNRAKAFCFDNNITEEQMEDAWQNAIEEGNWKIKSLDREGLQWWGLPPHLLKQLIERYGGGVNE